MSGRVDGMDRLRHKLGLLTDAEEQAVRQTITASAEAIQAGAKNRAPVRGGKLRDSIAVEMVRGELAAKVGTNVFYGLFQEFGTVKHAAHPFLFPAFEEERPRFVRNLVTALNRGAAKVAR